MKNEKQALIILKDFINAEKDLRKYIKTLRNYGKDCDCKTIDESVVLVDEYEQIEYCIDCGGVIYN